MRRVKSQNTSPEIKVRSILHSLGYRFRLHHKDLPGSPDIVLPKHRKAIFVHGCFWHRHRRCSNATTPSSRQEYWLPKFARTIERDRLNQEKLQSLGWRVHVIWECETKKPHDLRFKIQSFFDKEYCPEQNKPILAKAAEKAEAHYCRKKELFNKD